MNTPTPVLCGKNYINNNLDDIVYTTRERKLPVIDGDIVYTTRQQ
jgi:hypothetical protein